MERRVEHLLKEHFRSEGKMAFLVGPRQVGKTTSALRALPGSAYLNWDNQEHRKIILRGPSSVLKFSGGERITDRGISVIFDEIHKYPRWKTFLKGFFDTCGKKVKICVTGSARLDVYKHGGDSMMGRYFQYRMHPLSVREIVTAGLPTREVSSPVKIKDTEFNRLWEFGGYPEPYLRHDRRFSNRWQRLRLEQLFNEDLRDLSRISDVGRVKVFAERIRQSAGSGISYSNLANDLQVSVDTIRRWFEMLESIYYCFRVRPYSKNIARSLLKEPKVFLWDWACLNDPGRRAENFIASHLLKAVHYNTDTGQGDYRLYYLRDKSHREVDFLVTRDARPWFLAEVKLGDHPISESLRYFKEVTRVPHAFQLTLAMDYVDADCFQESGPIKVPAKTFLSQLL